MICRWPNRLTNLIVFGRVKLTAIGKECASREEMRNLVADLAAIQRYNGWLFFTYDETTRYGFR
jgi:hypothetical protein